MKTFIFALILASLVLLAAADVYLHNPRGSNNRNREDGVTTANANRLFDSQNNNKGGYCWGPAMTYYEGSVLQIEWTNQHGCGADHPNVDCDIILQYMCGPKIRDGITTNTINEDNAETRVTDPLTGELVYEYGMHEDAAYYAKCKVRQRNVGLYAADQNLPITATAMRSRQQNNQNNPHGFECEEERVFYPYWHPSPWRDIAILTSNTDRCAYFKEQSENVLGKNECSKPEYNNEAECEKNNGRWTLAEPHGIAAPECVAGGFSRDNHLGNTKTGFTNVFNWEIPRLDTIATNLRNTNGDTANCIFRIRYNISTSDTRSWRHIDNGERMLDSTFNDEKSPVKGNPYIGYGKADGHEWLLRLALNTNQYGRTFEDRSHMFRISRRPAGVSDIHRIINLNVRGKRGNIVQTYPAVEYDFVPNQLQVNVGDFIHFQWTGCNTNPNYDGEGTQRTDRSNIVQLANSRDNIPVPFDQQTMFEPARAFLMAHLNQYKGKVCATTTEENCCLTLEQLREVGGNQNENPRNCFKLNDPKAAYFDGGVVQMKTAGTYHYMSSRNNNFTNRSQKGSITVGSLLPTWGIVVAVTGATGFVAATGVAGAVYFAQTHPGSAVAGALGSVRI